MNAICLSVVTSNILTESSFVPLSHETFPEHNIKRFFYHHHHSKAKSATSSLPSTASTYSTFPCDNCFPSVNISLSSYYYVQAMKNGGGQYLRHFHPHHDQQPLPRPASSSYLTSYMFTSWGREGAGPDPISEDIDWSFKFRD